MWSTADVMNELRNHRQTCAKIAIIENTLKQAESARSSYTGNAAAGIERPKKGRRELAANPAYRGAISCGDAPDSRARLGKDNRGTREDVGCNEWTL